jgi:ubiquinone/menaquinone biosynthesis C-methylase UbiE
VTLLVPFLVPGPGTLQSALSDQLKGHWLVYAVVIPHQTWCLLAVFVVASRVPVAEVLASRARRVSALAEGRLMSPIIPAVHRGTIDPPCVAGEEVPRTPSLAQLRSCLRSGPLGWHDYADLWLGQSLGTFLDYGCGAGSLLRRVVDRCSDCWGVDIDDEPLQQASEIRGVRVRAIAADGCVPFPDATFDNVSITEVIEHVADERRVLGELTRVLKPGGQLLLTTPHRGLLTFLDPANIKFAVPRLHRFIHRIPLQNISHYESRFGSARKTKRNMIADFTLDQRPWHRHYKYEQIRALTPPELEPLAWAAYFPAMRALWLLGTGVQVASLGRIKNTGNRFGWLKSVLSRRQTRLGDQLVVLFRKR